MSKRKGVSAEEKRNRMLEIFHETREFYQMKDLEKIAPKMKGIVAQSVKEVVQNLVDEGLVDTDKIGTSTYYWSYPNKFITIKKQRLDNIEKEIEEIESKMKKNNEKLRIEMSHKDDSLDQTELINNISELTKQESELSEKLKLYAENDPDLLDRMKHETSLIAAAVNRWTDNIFAIKSWCKKKFAMEESVLNKHFGIPEDLDYMYD